MADVPYPSDHDRLVDNIRQELEGQRAGQQLPLDPAIIDQLAAGIATNIEYAFEVRWAPGWVKDVEPHRWIERPPGQDEAHIVECLRCRRITSHPTAEAADMWWSAHLVGGHP